jgi:hypothetical protein
MNILRITKFGKDYLIHFFKKGSNLGSMIGKDGEILSLFHACADKDVYKANSFREAIAFIKSKFKGIRRIKTSIPHHGIENDSYRYFEIKP